MKIQPNNINKFLSQIPQSVSVILLYGPDQGLSAQRQKQIIKIFLGDSFDKSSLVYIYESNLRDSPGILEEELNTFSLFGDMKKIVILRDIKDSVFKAHVNIIENFHNNDVKLILCADELSPSSAMRKFAETHDNAAAIPCYMDSGVTLKEVINQKLIQNNFAIEPSALEFLLENLGADRMVSISELEKLILYKYQEKMITLSDVVSSIADQSLIAYDKFIYKFFDKNFSSAYTNLLNLLQGENPIAITRTLVGHVMKLLNAKSCLKKGESLDSIIKNSKPPILFMYVDQFKNHVKLWDNMDLEGLLSKLVEIEILCKTDAFVGQMELKHLLVEYNN